MSTADAIPRHHAWARVRLADKRDVSHVRRLIHKMAEFYHLDHIFSATDSSLSTTLFPEVDPLPPFKSVTVFILEVSPESFPPSDGQEDPFFTPTIRRLDLDSPIVEPESEVFASPRGGRAVVAGFIIFFPNFSTFLGKPGFYVEDLYVREPYRRRGFAGEMLLSAVAGQAVRMGLGRVEWSIIVWNTNSIKFYEGMGAEVLQDWRICRLSGDKLQAFGQENGKPEE